MESNCLKIGTRGSPLALWQTRSVSERIQAKLPDTDFQTVEIASPGDEDLAADLRESPPDFFTRSLDEALLAGTIDLAVHSAKDMPDPVPAGIDWFWMPDAGDRRDALVGSLDPKVIGVSSDRRADYAQKRFPDAVCKSIRGNIQERLRKLDQGEYDLLIMAGVALQRLGLERRIAEWIPFGELDPPEAQGVLAATFRSGDRRMLAVRNLFIKAAAFVGAGVCEGHLTLAGMRALQSAEVCLYDALMDDAVLQYLPERAQKIYVGKRRGAHSRKQDDINRLLCDCVRKGRRTVRLKGGDPGIFGRLAEEVDALETLGLASRVVPGISAMQTAAADTGIQLTRRGVARGFSVMTPRVRGGGLAPVDSAARAALPTVFYMAVGAAADIAAEMIADGTDSKTDCALVFGAGSDRETVVRSPLDSLDAALARIDESVRSLPGLFIVGEIAGYACDAELGALGGRRVLLTCSEALMPAAVQTVFDLGGRPIARPLIRLELLPQAAAAVRGLERFDWIALTSPSAARCLHELLLGEKVDFRSIPKIMVTGSGTARALEALGIGCDLMPETRFSAEGILAAAAGRIDGGRVLRLRSRKAGPELAEGLRAAGAEVEDCVLYENISVSYSQVPVFDSVFFASASAVESFVAQWGADALAAKTVLAIGEPTRAALVSVGVAPDVVGKMATVEKSIHTLASFYCGAIMRSPNRVS